LIKKIIQKIKGRISNLINSAFFIANKGMKNSVLLAEVNACHLELLPSYAAYLKKLGYKVDIMTLLHRKNCLPDLSCYAHKIFYFTFRGFKNILKSKKIKEYDFVIFTSYILFYKTPDKLKDVSKLYDHIDIKHKPKYGVIHTLHDTKEKDDTVKKEKGAIVLSKILKKDDEKLYVVNPCFFKNFDAAYINKPKNEKTIFVTVGKLQDERKNAWLLFDAAKNLIQKGCTNFKINLAGENTLDIIPCELKPYFEITYQPSFNELYKILERADFFLPLLDPSNEKHLRYITTGTSGSFQLIRGFLLPPVIHKTFAKKHNFSNDCAIIYDDNKNFANALIEAIHLQEDKYSNMRQNLLKSRDEIIKNSIENLKNFTESLKGST